MPERSVFDAASRALTLVRQHLVALFVLGLLLEVPMSLLWSALERALTTHVTMGLDTVGALKLAAMVGGGLGVVLVLRLLLQALVWGAASEVFIRDTQHAPAGTLDVLTIAGEKFAAYFASFCAFLVPAVFADLGALIGAFVVLLLAIYVPAAWPVALLLGLLVGLAYVPALIWSNGFALLLIPAAVRGEFGLEGFRTLWRELRGEWLALFAMQLLIFATTIGLVIAGGIVKMFLPDGPSTDWEHLFNLAQSGGWETIMKELVTQPAQWRDYASDGIDCVRDALVFAFSVALVVCWYFPRDRFPSPELNAAARE